MMERRSELWFFCMPFWILDLLKDGRTLFCTLANQLIVEMTVTFRSTRTVWMRGGTLGLYMGFIGLVRSFSSPPCQLG